MRPARGFLAARGLVGEKARSQIPPANVFFELTKEAKVARVAAVRCDVFVDDLPEILAMSGFPEGMRRILFDPDDKFAGSTRSQGGNLRTDALMAGARRGRDP